MATEQITEPIVEQDTDTQQEPIVEPVEPVQEPEQPQEVDYIGLLNEQLQDKESAVYKAFTEAVKAEVEKRLAGQTPKANPTDRTKNQLDRFRNMSYKERAELARANPDTYQKLVQLERSK